MMAEEEEEEEVEARRQGLATRLVMWSIWYDEQRDVQRAMIMFCPARLESTTKARYSLYIPKVPGRYK